MTYSTGSTILAADFNGFVGPTASGGTAGANLNDIWSTGSGDKGWGQTAIPNATAGAVVQAGVSTPVASATQWAGLVTDLGLASSQVSYTPTSRTAPTAGQTIGILAALNTDLTAVTNARGNCVTSAAQVTLNGSSAPIAEANNSAGWNMTFTQTLSFTTAAQARYFWNTGGRAQITMSKTGTGTDKDPDWNAFVATVGTISFVGRVNGANQSIGGVTYTGTSMNGTGSGGPTVATTTGWYSLTPGAAATQIFSLTEGVAAYGSDTIKVTAAVNAGGTAITFTTVWHDNGYSGAGKSNNTSAGGAVALSYYASGVTYIANSWGTPTLSSSVA